MMDVSLAKGTTAGKVEMLWYRAEIHFLHCSVFFFMAADLKWNDKVVWPYILILTHAVEVYKDSHEEAFQFKIEQAREHSSYEMCQTQGEC